MEINQNRLSHYYSGRCHYLPVETILYTNKTTFEMTSSQIDKGTTDRATAKPAKHPFINV